MLIPIASHFSGTIRYREFVNLMLIMDGVLKEPVEETDQALQLPARQRSVSVSED